MKTLFTLITLLFISLAINAQDAVFEWVANAGGTGIDVGDDLVVDEDGNSYAVGGFNGTIDFDPSDGVFELNSIGQSDLYVYKLDTNGNLIWAKSIGSDGGDNCRSIAIDINGDIYFTGFFSGTADFDPGDGVFNLTPNSSRDVYVCKLDGDGNFLWAQVVAFAGVGIGNAVETDILGNVYLSGNFFGTADFDPSDLVYNLTAQGERDAFILKLDTNGNFIWAKQLGATSLVLGQSLIADSNSNIYLGAFFEDTVDVDPGVGEFIFNTNGEFDSFIVKLNMNGDFVWGKHIGGEDDDTIENLIIDHEQDLIITGDFKDTVDFDPGDGVYEISSFLNVDPFVLKLDLDGEFIWARGFGGSSGDIGIASAVDSENSIYTIGYFEGIADFDPSDEVFEITSFGNKDIYINKLDSEGNFIWVKQFGGNAFDGGRGIRFDGLDNMYSTGFFRSFADFDPSDEDYTVSSLGVSDVYVLKMSTKNLGVQTIDVVEVEIYPNPVSDYVYFKNAFNQEKVSIYDMTGRLIKETKIDEMKKIDVQNLQSGSYILKIDNMQSVIMLKE